MSADCSDSTQVCRNNQCVGCIDHGECASQVCDAYGDLPGGGAGKCLPTTNITYVDNRAYGDSPCNIAPPQSGKQGDPLCSLTTAIGKAKTTPGKIIRVLPSPNIYLLPPLDASSGNVLLIGSGFMPGNGSSLAVDNDLNPSHFVFTNANVVLDGFRFSAEGVTGSGGKLTIRRSKFDAFTAGIAFDTNATVTLDRNLFTENTIGLSFDSCTVNVTNSIMYQNNVDLLSAFLTLKGGSGSFQFNTVAFNINMSSAPAAPIVSCISSGVTVKNSIFVQNGVTQEIAPGCTTTGNSIVVGRSDTSPGQIKQDPTFSDSASFNLQLNATDATNQQYLIDKATVSGSEKNTDHDYNGAPRPQGNGHDIGAYEVPAMQ